MSEIWVHGEYTITTDSAHVNIDVVHCYLNEESYWAKDIPREVVARSIAHSLCFSVLHEKNQIGFARVTTDRATVAYLGDVFILPAHRGHGLAKWLMECVSAHADLQGLHANPPLAMPLLPSMNYRPLKSGLQLQLLIVLLSILLRSGFPCHGL